MKNKETQELVEGILETARISSEQEYQRSQLLLTKSHYLVTYVTGTFVFLNAFCLFLLKLKTAPGFMVLALYAVPSIALCGALWQAVSAQSLVRVEYFPTGQEIIQGIIDKNKKNITVTALDHLGDRIIFYSKYTDSLKEANDKRAGILKSVYRLFIGAVISIAGLTALAVITGSVFPAS